MISFPNTNTNHTKVSDKEAQKRRYFMAHEIKQNANFFAESATHLVKNLCQLFIGKHRMAFLWQSYAYSFSEK